MKIILLVTVVAILVTIAWACCMAAATSDEDAERIYQGYLEYKRKKEEEKCKE